MNTTSSKKLTNAVLIVMLTTFLSRIIGFVREMLLPNMIGVGVETDAYLNAYMFPDLMYSLLMGGAIAAALIPILTGYIDTGNEEKGWYAVSTFINFVFIVMLILCVLGMIFAPYLMEILISGADKADTRVLATKLSRILFPSVAFLMLSGLLNGILNSHKRFAAAALGPIIYNVGNALSIYFLSPYGITKIAYGVMASSILYFLIQLSFTYKNLKYYKFGFFFNNNGSKGMFKLAIPSFISASVVQINIMVSTKFSNFFEDGRITAFKMADKTWQMPYGIFAVSLGIAILPTLSGLFANKKTKEFADLLIKSIKNVLVIVLPCALAFLIMNERIIRTIFQFTARFNENDVQITSHVLLFFSIALVTQSVVTILNRAFYASHDTKTPLYIGTVTIIINISVSYLLYKYSNMDVYGISLAYSLASVFNATLLMYFIKKKLKEIKMINLFIFLSKLLIPLIAMSLVVILMNQVSFDNSNSIFYSKVFDLVYLVIIAFVGALVYFATAVIIKIPEGIAVYNKICIKLKLQKLVINGNINK